MKNSSDANEMDQVKKSKQTFDNFSGQPGVVYRVNSQEIIRYMRLSAEAKLEWLKNANTTIACLPPEIQALQSKFKQSSN